MTSYRELIADHEEIEAAARILMDDVKQASPANLTAVVMRLSILTDLVNKHVAKENYVLEDLRTKAATASWGNEWTSAANSFVRSREKWMLFVAKWDEGMIAAHWPEFRLEARSVMSHLQDQVTYERDLFYSVALREGAITLQ